MNSENKPLDDGAVEEAPMKETKLEPRLCNEIQLFDLCDGQDVCGHKDGRYCTKGDLLARFEAISDEDERSPEQYLADELDEVEGADDMGYDEAFGVDEYGEEEDEDE